MLTRWILMFCHLTCDALGQGKSRLRAVHRRVASDRSWAWCSSFVARQARDSATLSRRSSSVWNVGNLFRTNDISVCDRRNEAVGEASNVREECLRRTFKREKKYYFNTLLQPKQKHLLKTVTTKTQSLKMLNIIAENKSSFWEIEERLFKVFNVNFFWMFRDLSRKFLPCCWVFPSFILS